MILPSTSYPVINGSFGYGILGIFKSAYWNATTVDREISLAARLNITALRVFVCMRGREEDPHPQQWLTNYRTFQQMMQAHGLKLMVTFWWADPFSCTNATAYLHDVVAAEVPGVVIEYEAANEPQAAQAGDVKSCILPVLLNATSASGVDVGVGVGSYWEVVTYASLSTTLNWHSYNGGGNGAGLQAEIDNLTTLANSFSPPKPLLLTEWHARPAQPMAAAMPVIRDNGVGACCPSGSLLPLRLPNAQRCCQTDLPRRYYRSRFRSVQRFQCQRGIPAVVAVDIILHNALQEHPGCPFRNTQLIC